MRTAMDAPSQGLDDEDGFEPHWTSAARKKAGLVWQDIGLGLIRGETNDVVSVSPLSSWMLPNDKLSSP